VEVLVSKFSFFSREPVNKGKGFREKQNACEREIHSMVKAIIQKEIRLKFIGIFFGALCMGKYVMN
jgi:hypothetical protein